MTFLEKLVAQHGDVAHFRAGRQDYYVLSHPDDIRDVLITHSANFTKGPALRQSKVTLGEGLLTSEGDLHKRQRRLVQPAFHPKRVDGYGDTMVRFAERTAGRWREGQVLDIAEEMTQLTLEIVAKVLFDAEIERDVKAIGDAMAITVTMFDRARLPWAWIVNKLPLKSNRRFRTALAYIEELMSRMIRERRESGTIDRGDFLSILLRARDEEGDRGGMSDRQVRDEAITLFSAGHETTANALVWTWYLLADRPTIEAKLQREISEVLAGGRAPTVDDMPRLKYARQVVAESMRLFPPAWIIARQCTNDYSVRGYTLPAQSVLLMSEWIVHRDKRWWRDPEKFDPERWNDESIASSAQRPKYAYFPFGGGPRSCIGEPFAWMEAILILVTLAQKWRLRLLDPDGPLSLHPTITLRPRNPIPMRVERRA